MTHIGSVIAQDRQRLGLSQQELAAKLGVSQQSVSKWEECKSAPRGKRISQLVQVLGNNSQTAHLVSAKVGSLLTAAGEKMDQSVNATTQDEALVALASAAQEIAKAAQTLAQTVVMIAKRQDPPDEH